MTLTETKLPDPALDHDETADFSLVSVACSLEKATDRLASAMQADNKDDQNKALLKSANHLSMALRGLLWQATP